MTKKNPWAICTASVGRKDKKKYERCVKGVKKESGMKENILKAAFQKYIADPVKKKKQEFKRGFDQGYYTQTATGEERFRQKLKKERQEKPRGPVSTMTKMGPRGKINPATGTMNQSTEIVRDARQALAEACWQGYKAKGLKRKGNRMVPNCRPIAEDEVQTKLPRPERMKRAAKKAREYGADQVEAAEKAFDRGTKKKDKEFYEQSNFERHPAEEDINKPSDPVRKALQKRPPQQKNKPGKGRKLKKGQEPEYHETRKEVMGSATKGKARRANTGRMVQFRNRNKSEKAMSAAERDNKTKGGADAAAINLSQRIADAARKKGLYKGRKHIGDRARAEAVRAGKQKLDRKRPKDS